MAGMSHEHVGNALDLLKCCGSDYYVPMICKSVTERFLTPFLYRINKQSFGWTIQMIVPIGALIQVVVLTVITTLVAGYFPARGAARQPVIDGLREE